PSLFSTPLSRPVSPPFPSTTLFRSRDDLRFAVCQIFIRMFGESIDIEKFRLREVGGKENPIRSRRDILPRFQVFQRVDCDHYSSDRKSTRLNSSHVKSSYAVFCLKK